MFLQRHKIKENWNPEFLSSCEAEEFNNFQSIIVKDKQDFNKRKYLAFEKTWKLFYKSLGKEFGHLIDRAFGSDEERAIELARQHARERAELQENKKSINRILISIKRPTIY